MSVKRSKEKEIWKILEWPNLTYSFLLYQDQSGLVKSRNSLRPIKKIKYTHRDIGQPTDSLRGLPNEALQTGRHQGRWVARTVVKVRALDSLAKRPLSPLPSAVRPTPMQALRVTFPPPDTRGRGWFCHGHHPCRNEFSTALASLWLAPDSKSQWELLTGRAYVFRLHPWSREVWKSTRMGFVAGGGLPPVKA